MSEIPGGVNRRLAPRYVVFRECQVIFKGTAFDVALLNVSKSGVAVLGSLTEIAPGDSLDVVIEGIFLHLKAMVVNVNLGRIGAKFDLLPEIATVWEEEFLQLTAGLPPMD